MAAMNKIHSSNWLYLAVCLLGVGAFYLVGIRPNTIAMQEAQTTIAELKTKIETQELLYPVFTRLIQDVQQESTTLVLPEAVPIKRADATRIADRFAPLAAKNGVQLENVTPDSASYLQGSTTLTVNALFSGDFFNFRNLLTEICSLPFLAAIDQLDIRSTHDGAKLALRMQILQEPK